jgi:uncharacterized membrane protein YfhO
VDVRRRDQPDGTVDVTVNAPTAGWVFFSEPRYVERVAFVDGARTPSRRANVAFTAVPVAAGVHRVELRYVPTSFWRGASISAATLVLWPAGALIARRRRRLSPAIAVPVHE